MTQIDVATGHEMYVTSNKEYADKSTDEYLYIDYPHLGDKVQPGRFVYI